MRNSLYIVLVALQMSTGVAEAQNSETVKFYNYYHVDAPTKLQCDSIFNLIEQRRSAFSKEFRAYKSVKGNTMGFAYNWTPTAELIAASLEGLTNKPIKHLVYYSYFDLGYGAFGLRLDSSLCKIVLKEIETTSSIWAMEPSLLEAVIKFGGGEEKNARFIKKIVSENKDAGLVSFVKNNLLPDRALRVGKILPVLKYRSLADTMKILTTEVLGGQYYLIDIWATWCNPCIEEFPTLLNAYKNRPSSIEFISISIDKYARLPIEFHSKKIQLPWSAAIATNRKELMNALMISGIPCTILISPEGKILAYGNDLRGENLQKTLDEIVKR